MASHPYLPSHPYHHMERRVSSSSNLSSFGPMIALSECPSFPPLLQLKKPMMEKRRRARINDCLNQLKTLLLQVPSLSSRLGTRNELLVHLRRLRTSGRSWRRRTFWR